MRNRSRFAPPRAPLDSYPPHVRGDIAKLRDQQDRAESALAKFDVEKRQQAARRKPRKPT